MQPSSSGEGRNSRNSRPRGEGRSGGRPRNRSRQGGPRRSSDRSDRERSAGGTDEFRPSEHVARKPRRESSKPAPQPTALEKFLKIITFGLYDPTAKKRLASRPPREAREPRAPREAGEAQRGEAKRERRAPSYIEPTTPRLYVGNLSYNATDADLATLFAAHGSVVEASVVTQGATGRSKGFAFVEMSSVEEAKAAAAALNDHEWQGRKMLVTGAKSEGRDEERSETRVERAPRQSGRGERRERGERGRGGRSRGDSDEIDKPSRQVRPLIIETVESPALNVENLNAEASETDLADLFAGIGTIVHREETGPGRDERTKNFRIDLTDTAEAQKAVELLDGKCFMGHQLRITGAKA